MIFDVVKIAEEIKVVLVNVEDDSHIGIHMQNVLLNSQLSHTKF